MGNVDGEDNIRSGWELEDKYVDDAASYATVCILSVSLGIPCGWKRSCAKEDFRSGAIRFSSCMMDVLELRGSAFWSP